MRLAVRPREGGLATEWHRSVPLSAAQSSGCAADLLETPMSKMTELIEGFIEAESRLMVHLPGEGYVRSRIESMIDDVVTVAPEGRPKVVIHFTRLAVRL